MSNTLTWTLNVQIPGGPTIKESPEPMVIEAYDQIDTVIKPGPKATTVTVQPGSNKQICFMVIRADKYPKGDTPDKGIGYHVKVNPPPATETWTDLDTPQVFVGFGSASLFDSDPKIFEFKNSFEEDVAVHLLIGRKALE